MRSLRILVVLLTLVAGLREAGAAACASACPRPMRAASHDCGAGADACCPFPDAPPVDCPLLDAAPAAVLVRAPATASPSDFRAPASLPVLFTAPPAPPTIAPAGVPGWGSPPRAQRSDRVPLWLVDLRLLI